MLVPSDIPNLLKPGRTVLLPGRILVSPHGKLIWNRKKTAILSSRLMEKYIEVPVYLIEGEKALGIIEIKKPKKISLQEAKKLRNKHRVSDKEINEWWKGKKFLYYYPVKLISKFDPPKEIIRPEGAQVWLQSVTFKSLDMVDPSELTDEELIGTHEKVHKMWEEGAASKEDIINYHILIKNELLNRKLSHKDIDSLDRESKQFQERFSKAGYKVSFYGTKGLVEEEGPGHRFHTSILYEFQGKRLLVDYGKINQGNIGKLGADYILISHAHPDHIGGCSDLSVIISKDTEKEIPNLYKDFNIDARTKYESYKTFSLGPFKITPIPVLHSLRAKMHVFLIQMGDKRVLQATDILGWHSGDKEKYVKNIDLAIIDGSSLTKTLARKKNKEGEPFGHASIVNQLKNWYTPDKVKRVIVTHLGKETLALGDDELLAKIKEITKVPVVIATDNIVINLSEDTAPIYTSGKVLGKRIFLKDILPYFKNFLIQRPICYLTGGLVNQGSTRGDIDLLLPEWLSFDMRRIIEFRIARSVPWYIRRRLHFVYDKFSTPFTHAIPLYNLAMLRSKDKMIRLSDVKKQLREKPRDVGAIKDAEASAREDKVKLFRYFLPLKPTRGYYPEKRQTIDLFIEVMENMGEYPFYSTKKFDGANCLDGNTMILTKKGRKRIADLVKKKSKIEVLSFNEKKRVFEFKPIIGHFLDFQEDKWYELRFQRKDNRNKIVKLVLTGDHQVYTLNGKEEARRLKIGDEVLTSIPKLNKIQEQVLLGSLFGDGCIHKTKSNSLVFQESHSIMQKEYLEWKRKIFGACV
ncbi:MBL fold metallo-hydrolase, partial [bacterium]|nr:MBL fold metallo-hydrolase [bacterium]